MWIIDKDHDADPKAKPGTNLNAVGITGGHSERLSGISLKNLVKMRCIYKFRMLTDDQELMYSGRSSFIGFAPLDDFGTPNAGCTRIDYWNTAKNVWEIL